ncbi:hypothetical protein C8J57DRAFT_627581 [Mycena rebaudengoi]|nr:hypothetical protein C8J57DRAFT_627581 [Mycena rebaudengoi]
MDVNSAARGRLDPYPQTQHHSFFVHRITPEEKSHLPHPPDFSEGRPCGRPAITRCRDVPTAAAPDGRQAPGCRPCHDTASRIREGATPPTGGGAPGHRSVSSSASTEERARSLISWEAGEEYGPCRDAPIVQRRKVSKGGLAEGMYVLYIRLIMTIPELSKKCEELQERLKEKVDVAGATYQIKETIETLDALRLQLEGHEQAKQDLERTCQALRENVAASAAAACDKAAIIESKNAALTKLRAKCETLETAKNELAASVKGQADVIKNLTAEFEALQVTNCQSTELENGLETTLETIEPNRYKELIERTSADAVARGWKSFAPNTIY